MELNIKYGSSAQVIEVPEKNLLYHIAPKQVLGVTNEAKTIQKSLKDPIGSPSLRELVQGKSKVLVLVDDLTRPTPRDKILPVLLNELNQCGIKDHSITIMVALGTHRYMKEEELKVYLGKEVARRVEIVNHEWKNKNQLVYRGKTKSGISIVVNRKVCEADFVIGVGSIVPHNLAGWGGGAKIIQPGICSWETTCKTHLLPLEKDEYLDLVGKPNNRVRLEIEQVAQMVGLKFILNVVINAKQELVCVVAGDPVKAHRVGVRYAKEIYERPIPQLADVVVVSAYPAEIDYWQGLKPLSYTQHGLKKRGTAILMGSFPEGVSDIHPELEKYGRYSYEEAKKLLNTGQIKDLVCASGLLQHTLIMDRCRVICVSRGLTESQKYNLKFIHAENFDEALHFALEQQGKNAKIGVIDFGGDVLPKFEDSNSSLERKT